MKQIRVTPAFVVASLALVVAVSSGTAVAASLVTGAQVRDRSLTGVDLKRDSVTGNEVKESTLGAVPNSSRLGGQPPSSYLRSGRVVSGSASILGGGEPVVLSYPRLGVVVKYVAPARVKVENVSTPTAIGGDGVAHYGSVVVPQFLSLNAGESKTFVVEATGVSYLHLALRTRVVPASASQVATLTCLLDDNSPGNAMSCVMAG